MSPASPCLPPAVPEWNGILFDLDGTLADTAPDLGWALNALLRSYERSPLELELIRPHASAGARGLLQLGLAIDPEHPDFAALRTEFLTLYLGHVCVDTRLFPGMAAVLAQLETRGFPWGIVTNKPTRFTLPLLQQLGLNLSHHPVICGDTCAHSKPHPAPLLKAAQELGLPPNQVIYVGDDARDMEAAAAASMGGIIARYGYLGTQTDPDSWPALGGVDHPAQLLAWLALDLEPTCT